ncbi:MAG: hypothetical protein NTY06_02425 [Candidatus Gottesmanbacteria bacterium]|nr:hypothetical protein [Candidatus Gottesmanbacteria bacterium]
MRDRFFDLLRKRAPISVSVEVLRKQPLIREFWLAQDAALKQIFDGVNNKRFNEGITRVAEDIFTRMSKNGKVPKGQEGQYRELCLRNARRIEWDVAAAEPGFHEELEPQWQGIVQAELEKMGVWNEFNQLYGPDSTKGKIISTDPDKPYF